MITQRQNFVFFLLVKVFFLGFGVLAKFAKLGFCEVGIVEGIEV